MADEEGKKQEKEKADEDVKAETPTTKEKRGHKRLADDDDDFKDSNNYPKINKPKKALKGGKKSKKDKKK
jgi:hypothetical protein